MKYEIISFTALAAALFLGGCTYYVPAKLDASREGDTLTVALAGHGAARWDPRKDSLVIECVGCSAETARQVEYFTGSNRAQFDIANSQELELYLYSMGSLDTMEILPGDITETRSYTKPHVVPRRPHETTAPSEATGAEQAKAVAEAKTAAAEKALKKVTLLKVTAAEGVAIYKDKTKREVLKILQQGSSIVLLAREGDLYSVSVDGEEGFVDAEAVEVQE